MQRQQHRVRHRPAESRRRQAEGRRRRQHDHFPRVDLARQYRADPVVKWIAGGQHADLPSAMAADLVDRDVEGARPSPRRPANKRRCKREMTPAAPIPTMDSQRGDAALCAEIVSINGSLPTGMSRILILGGTTEARELAARLAARADLEVIVSLAGRTKSPAPQPVPVRSGGFGGAVGLGEYLDQERIDALVDATHPYANIISANAAAAAHQAGVPLIALRRPAWRAVAGDRWIEAIDVADAVRRLGEPPRRVFVTLGRTELISLTTAPQHFYLIRSVDRSNRRCPCRAR